MGKKSIKENKNEYFKAREKANLTRLEASEETYISDSRIESIEYNQSSPRPDEVLAMAKAYNAANLCNYYCSHDCEIGKEYVPEIQVRHLSQSVLEMLASLKSLDKHKDRLIEMTADGVIDETEFHDLVLIIDGLERVSMAIDSFTLWVENKINAGVIDKEAIEKEKAKL